MELLDQIRRYWDADAATYDLALGHGARTPSERAAWSAALARHLPPPPARVLDVGAGTGFLSLTAARLGHEVTALDLSSGMLARLEETAGREGLAVDVVEGPADAPPEGPFAAVMERHLLWTLPDPVAALVAWRGVAPGGRLLVFEGLWGRADPVEVWRQKAHAALRRLRREPPHHHSEYDPAVRAQLPLADGFHPDRVIPAIEGAGWTGVTLERLDDVVWARLLALPPLQRLVGITPPYLVTAR